MAVPRFICYMAFVDLSILRATTAACALALAADTPSQQATLARRIGCLRQF